MRIDSYNYSGLFYSPRAGVLIVPANGATIKLLYGRAFRAPSARELLVQVQPDELGTVPFTNGNPDLLPESIDTIEASLSGTALPSLWMRSSFFFSQILNPINKTLIADPNLGDQYYANLGPQIAFGGEAEVQWRPKPFMFDLSYSGTYAMEMETGRVQYEFPLHMGHFRLGWTPFSKYTLNLRGDLYGTRPRVQWTPDSNLEDGPPFALLHFSGSVKPFVDRELRIDTSINNLLNSEYKTLIYHVDANALSDDQAKSPNDLEGEGRALYISVTTPF